MAGRLYKRNAILLAKIETTEGVDAVPTAAANAMYVTEVDINPLEGSAVDIAYIRPYMGAYPSMRVEDFMTLSATVDLAGAASAGISVPWAALIRSCGVSEVLQAAAVNGLGQATGNVAAASNVAYMKLAVAESAVTDIHMGKKITITSGTGNGQSGIISAYDGTTKIATILTTTWVVTDATSNYSIAACASYSPATPTTSTALDSCTIYYNIAGVRHKLLGARGTVSLDVTSNARPTLKFNMTANYGGIVDASEGTPAFTGWQTPLAGNSANSRGFIGGKFCDGSATGVQMDKLSLDFSNQVKHRVLIGSESVQLTDRQIKGNTTIEMTSTSFQDWIGNVRNASKGPLFLENGLAAGGGNTVMLFMPNAQLLNPKYGETDGIVELSQDFNAIPRNGNDELRIVVR